MTATLIQQAREALRLAESDPASAMAAASTVIARAAGAADHAARSVALRALGLAATHREDLDSSIGYLRSAIAFGQRAAAPQLAGEARTTLAFALSSRGRPRQALREIDR